MNATPLRERFDHGVAVLSWGGDLDLSVVGEVEDAIVRTEARRPDVLVLDLRDVTFIDSSILRQIVAAHVRARREDRRFVVAAASEAVRRVFRVTLLEWRLEIVDDPDAVRPDPGRADPR